MLHPGAESSAPRCGGSESRTCPADLGCGDLCDGWERRPGRTGRGVRHLGKTVSFEPRNPVAQALPTPCLRGQKDMHGMYMERTWNVHGFNDREYGVNMGERIRRARSKSAMIYVWISIGKHMVKHENREGTHLPLRAVFRLSIVQLKKRVDLIFW